MAKSVPSLPEVAGESGGPGAFFRAGGCWWPGPHRGWTGGYGSGDGGTRRGNEVTWGGIGDTGVSVRKWGYVGRDRDGDGDMRLKFWEE